MTRLEQVLVLLLGLLFVGMIVGAALGQDIAKAARKGVEKADVGPKEVKIPESRTDRVLLLQEQAHTAELEQRALIERFKASPEWKALEDKAKAVADKYVAELSSALKLAGVEEKDFDKYQFDKEKLLFTLRPVEAPKAEPAKEAKP